jgi:hypothetical protein
MNLHKPNLYICLCVLITRSYNLQIRTFIYTFIQYKLTKFQLLDFGNLDFGGLEFGDLDFSMNLKFAENFVPPKKN